MKATSEILYSINDADVQNVARQELDRELTATELAVVKEHIGDQLDWYGAIATLLEQHIASHEIAK